MGKFLFKVCVFGNSVSTLNNYVTHVTRFEPQNMQMTIGFSTYVHQIKSAMTPATLQLWVFSNNERFNKILSTFVSGSSGAIVIFDLLNDEIIEMLEKKLAILRNHTQNIPVLLLGDKCDIFPQYEYINNL